MMTRLVRATATVASLCMTLSLLANATRANEPQTKTKAKAEVKQAASAQHWEGTLKVRAGVELRLVVNVKHGPGGATTATLDSPDEGVEGLKLNPFTLSKSENRLTFGVTASGAKYEGKLNAEGTEAAGTWSQSGLQLPLTFKVTKTPTPMPKLVGAEQIWEGKLSVGAGMSLRIVIHVGKDAGGKLMAKMDSPDQGAKGLPVDTITLDKTTLSFEMKRIMGKYEGKINAAGTEAVGTWTQVGNSFPLNLKKTDKASELRRPQTPKPPFPYKVVDVSYPNKPGGVTLSGTLTEPEGNGPFPAVILISGSGAQDRDETLFEHKPFLLLADTLTRRGIAVLRVDDRGVGGSTGNTARSTSDDFAGDVLSGITFLKSRSEIDAKHLGLIGHSEGGIIAPMVATRSEDVAFIVLMAGTGLPGEDIVQLQGQLILKAAGTSEQELKQQLEVQKKLFQIVKTEKDEKVMETKMGAVLKEIAPSLSDEMRKELAKYDALVKAQLKSVRTPWFRYFLTYDPRPTLAKVRCPVLAIIGEKDLQVPPKENLSQIETTLKTAGNKRITIKQLPGLNHLFQTCKVGSPSEYAEIEETISPTALAVMSNWIVENAEIKAH
jgi:pimeloyl-ACP methyl ester carboxylesterase